MGVKLGPVGPSPLKTNHPCPSLPQQHPPLLHPQVLRLLGFKPWRQPAPVSSHGEPLAEKPKTGDRDVDWRGTDSGTDTKGPCEQRDRGTRICLALGEATTRLGTQIARKKMQGGASGQPSLSQCLKFPEHRNNQHHLALMQMKTNCQSLGRVGILITHYFALSSI